MLKPFIGIGILTWATGALAEPVAVTNADLKGLVSGATVEIDTPLGTKIPIRFGDDGMVSGQALDLAPILGSEKDRGRWWIDGDKLCSKWFRWFDAEVRCITVQQDGSRLYWRKDDGETGTATVIERAREPAPTTTIAQAPPQSASAAPADKAATASIPLPIRKPTPPTIFAQAGVGGDSSPAQYKAAAADAPTAGDDRVAEASSPADISTDTAPQADVPQQATATADADATAQADQDTKADATPAPSAATPAPTEVALTESTPAAENGANGGPMMRFGAGGLLEASGRVPTEQAAPPAATPPIASLPAAAPPRAPQKSAERAAKVATAMPAAATRTTTHRTATKAGPAVKPAPSKQSVSKQGGASIATASVTPAVLYRVRGVESDDVLNVRRGPSEEHPQIAAIPATGRRVVITGPCSEAWCPIQYGHVKGWVNSLYLAEDSPQASSSDVYTAKR